MTDVRTRVIMYVQGGKDMKNERIYIRTTEKMKLKLLKKSQEYDMNLSDFMLKVAERECDLDIIQVWIRAYIDLMTKWNEDGKIVHYKLDEGEDAWSVSAFEDTYYNRVDLLEAIREHIELPRIWDVLDQWDVFVQRLKLLGMWEELHVIR